jgi:hypothetical protein
LVSRCSSRQLESWFDGFEDMVRGWQVPRQAIFLRRGTEIVAVAAGTRAVGAEVGEGEEVTLLVRDHPFGYPHAEL